MSSEHTTAGELLRRHSPPCDAEQELRAIGRAMHELDVIDEMGSLRSEMFYIGDNGIVFEELRKWRASDKAFSGHYFLRFLEKEHPRGDGAWERLLADAISSVPHAGGAAYDAQLVQELWVKRQSIYVATDIIRSAHEAVDFAADLAGHQTALRKLGESGEGTHGGAIQPGLLELMAEWESGGQAGLPSGFPQFDALVKLLPVGVYVLAGRPGQGKSAFALAVAEHVSRTEGVLFFSLEMGRNEVLARLVSRVIEIPAARIGELVRRGNAPANLADTLADLSQRTFIIDDRDNLTAEQMAATARIHAAKCKLGLMVIDYCQLITPRDKRVSREQQVAEISRSIKQLAKQVNLPILLLSQMSRAVESRDGKFPQLSDLRESGAIENDADAVIFIHDESPQEATQKRVLVVRKNRHGQEGTVPVQWLPQFTTFRPIKPEWHTTTAS